jgi:cephalosporin hydroxylase
MKFIRKLKVEGVRTLKNIQHRLYFSPSARAEYIEQFHKLYYDAYIENKTWGNTWWMGVPVRKCPLDLWLYQEMIFQLKPDVIIESGTMAGGSALYFASLFDLIGRGTVVTSDTELRPWEKDIVEIYKGERPVHPRIKYIHGSSVAPETLKKIEGLVKAGDKVMVILDSDHRKEHVLQELKAYSRWVSSGSYLVAEDTNINGHPVYPDFGPGPMEAVEEFLRDNSEFEIDKSKEKFLLSFNPKGFLRKR